MFVLDAQFHDRAERCRASVRGLERERFFHGEGSVWIFPHEYLKKFFVDRLVGQAGNVNAPVFLEADLFAGTNLLRLIGELLIMIETLPSPQRKGRETEDKA